MLSVLGRARIDGRDVGSRRLRQLLAALVLHRGTTVTTDRLAELVWADQQPQDPAASLHTLVSRLRAQLPRVATLDSLSGGYRLRVPSGDVDIEVLCSWRDRVGDASPEMTLATIDERLALVHGEAFADLDDVTVLAPRARVEEEGRALVEARAAALVALGRSDEAIAALRAVLTEHPDRESAVALLMETLYRAGRQLDALAAYSTLRDHLREQFGVDPTTRLAELELAILRHELRPGVRTVPRRRVIALPSSSFVGRADDVDGVAALARRSRLVTILGPGGMGKTRVAMQLAARWEAEGERVSVAELADVGNAADLAGAVAAMVGVSSELAPSPAVALCDHFGDDRWILVVDNCEHVLAQVHDLLATLLGSCARLSVVATSREPIGLDGEHRWTLHGLGDADAARLFLDRVAAHDTAAAPVIDDVREVCARLDGVPLALELAAAALMFTDMADLVRGLDDRFSILNHNRRGAPARHQSLEAVLDWSFDLLAADEREAFLRLGVFAGSFTLDDVRELLGEREAALVPVLVERSLVARVPGATPARFELLETLRAFARHRRGHTLDADDDVYAQWVLATVLKAVERLHGPDEVEHSRLIRRQMPGARHAYHWFVDHGDDAARVQLVTALVVWGWQCDQNEVMAWAVETDQAALATDPDTVISAATAATIALSRTLDLERAERCAERAIGLAHLASPPVAALAHYAAADLALFRGRPLDGVEHGARAYQLGVEAAPYVALFGAVDVAVGLVFAGDTTRADQWIDLADGLASRLGGMYAAAWVDYVRGERWAEEDPARSMESLTRCLERADPEEHSFLAGVAGISRLTATVRNGNDEEQQHAFRVLAERWRRGGSMVQLLTGLRNVVTLLVRDGRLRDGAVVLGAVLAASPDPSWDTLRAAADLRAIEEGLSADVVGAAMAEGAALHLDAAVDRALEMLAGPAGS
jgi:predicted ATPase/DNA-binding SARP family transcriptional activator